VLCTASQNKEVIMNDQWDTIQGLNNLASNQNLLIKKFVGIENKTSTISGVFITLLDLTKENVKSNFDLLKTLDIDSICKDITSFRDCLRFGLLEGMMRDLK